MMKAKTPLLVGLVVILGAAAFVLTFGSLEEGVDLDGGYTVHAVFDDATGLVVRSRVTVSGIPVGVITDIRLAEDDPSKARVSMGIRSDVALFQGIQDPRSGRWKNGCTALRLQASLLGDYYVALTPGVAGEPMGEGDYIQTVVTESGLQAVLDRLERSSQVIFPNLERVSEDIAAVTHSVRSALGDEEGAKALREIRDDIAQTADQVAHLSTEMRSFLGESVFPEAQRVKGIIRDVATTTEHLSRTVRMAETRLGQILGNVDTITADIRTFVTEQTGAAAEGKEGTVSSAIAKADRNLSLLEGTLENVRSVTAKIDQGDGTIGRLVNDAGMMDDVETVVSDVRDFTSTFSRLQVKVEFRSEYLFVQNAFKHYMTVGFHPKPDKSYLFQVISDPRGYQRRQQRVTTSNDPSKPPTVVEEIVTTENALKFSAQIAKRWHFLTFRYGLLESTGGFGIDLELLDDTLRFKMDVFDFGNDNWPRLRVLAAYEFARYVYVAAGVDDILNGANREYFVGLGVVFTDEDIKGLLPFLPSF